MKETRGAQNFAHVVLLFFIQIVKLLWKMPPDIQQVCAKSSS